jgi:hypothetical protein
MCRAPLRGGTLPRDACRGTPLCGGTPAEGRLQRDSASRRDACGGTPAEGRLQRDACGGTLPRDAAAPREACGGTPAEGCITAQGFSPGYAVDGNIEGLSLIAPGVIFLGMMLFAVRVQAHVGAYPCPADTADTLEQTTDYSCRM